ncbi:triphosphoribosyl-dephospho-CoA synthase [Stenotrophomonas rhizophila]|uniref:Probable 2-(5''-triphosphoribosyl)-3'-dephosphocoenzyme-A synthase n=1 Tax=Stenotrophomonas rhizophila TaxID=216778 RepID=A0A498CG88_9GAMM|nr:triphosphoribosyl-dephospho-CoA synthase MdcB [Stenotrophomonas rhizophila]RLK56003.1 triphosphoribosyl-dephospho-CoA synthase [Stenotrophomonas rhizophila]
MNAVPHPAPLPPPSPTAAAHRLARMAITSLHAELACAPKPGLVTPWSRGSHDDMDAATFLRSLFALRGYFVAVAAAGARNVPFDDLRMLGIEAEASMLRATGGINTHRGAIFSLGLLVAASARLRHVEHAAPQGTAVCHAVRGHWASALLAAPLNSTSPGQRARQRHGVPGVREQAAQGFPLLREVALPTLQATLRATDDRQAAMVQTLMSLVAVTTDLNLLHRGGERGLAFAQQQARRFLAEGGALEAGWRARLGAVCDAFEARRLSPGGSADLLACAWFLHLQERA